MVKKSKEIPLSEITLRKYERPFDLSKREASKKICLSLGLLQPGDSRDVIVDVFHVIHDAKEGITSDEIISQVVENRKQHNDPLSGIAPSNIRRQIKRLKGLFIIEKSGNSYRFTENSKLLEIFDDKIHSFYIRSILDRIREYLQYMDESF